jgi:hypothetical protein
MRARGWRVKYFSEMYPERPELLGTNHGMGYQILLRLREPYDRTQYRPFEKMVDVMLHELVHNEYAHHDDKFFAMLDRLREELDALMMKGYTGEAILGRGPQLGGQSLFPPDESRRLAGAEAEGRMVAFGSAASGSSAFGSQGNGLGTSLESFARRNRGDVGCANTNRTQDEIQAMSQMATRNGFRTRAEENSASEAAMAKALWGLMQEEKRKYGNSHMPNSYMPNSYMPSDAEDLFGSNRGPSYLRSGNPSSLRSGNPSSLRSGNPSSLRNDSYLSGTDFARDSGRLPPVSTSTRPPAQPSWRNDSYLSGTDFARDSERRPPTQPSWRNDSYLSGTDFARDSERRPPAPTVTRPPTRPRLPETRDSWACSSCRLHNPSHATACETCRFPRPGGLSRNSGRRVGEISFVVRGE